MKNFKEGVQEMSLEKIAEVSRKMGANPEYVLAGGGNTSWKKDGILYVKPSGKMLADMQPEDFVQMDISMLKRSLVECATVPADKQEDLVNRYALFSVIDNSGKTPSVEAILHALFDASYVVHLHPTLVNAMTCGKNGQAICAELFPEALWLGPINPGLTLALASVKGFEEYAAKYGKQPQIMFMQNHGVFVAGEDVAEIEAVYESMKQKLADYCKDKGAEVPAGTAPDADFIRDNAPLLRGLCAVDGVPAAVGAMNLYDMADGPFTPDHLVYAGSYPLVTDVINKDVVEAYRAKYGFYPKAVIVPGKAMFAVGKNVPVMRAAKDLLADAAAINGLAKAFGGGAVMPDPMRIFIENWGAEAKRRKQMDSAGVLSGKIALVTGGAQGFGFGIAEELVKAGAHVVIADLNLEGAKAAAAKFGKNASAVSVDVSSEDSVAAMADEVIREVGGLDLFVSNAGVLKAGPTPTFEKKAWDFVTAVNYTGYFLCVKHFTPMMAIQNKASGIWTDFVQVNSKSGLVGSNKNAAYAAGKFGTIGMTQSFALELVANNIKVNSVCPGNFYDGPLWSDPERGLFKQYLDAGKVPGAKTIADVKAFYLSKSPIQRGCFPADVAKAIIYCVSQQFETGQAIPVTGGQVMLS